MEKENSSDNPRGIASLVIALSAFIALLIAASLLSLWIR